MTASEFTALLVLCTATSFTPGPNTTLSTALAANRGLRGALHFVLAVPVGWGLLFGACTLGLEALLQAAPMLARAVQWSGVGYLLWLALRLWRSHTAPNAPQNRLDVTFFQGVLLQFLNIKAWMLALTVVAGWLAGRPDAAARMVWIFPILLAFALASNLTYAVLGHSLRPWLLDAEHGGRRLRRFNRTMALVLLATAVWMGTFDAQRL